ncbi:MAG: hypothetical protein DHS20C09_04230 [marine bacterium B5-7]|nr:MAG: hypothetical protein DHS20C09_04230 [marine bacterium B5-7]
MKVKTAYTIMLTVVLTSFFVSAWAAPPFGTVDDVNYAEALWKQLADERLVGKNAITSTPYTGMHPHGAILDTIDSRTTVKGHTGDVIVKKNYGGEGISKEAVANNPNKWLKAVTVMFRREKGFDSDNKDWFWVKYAPDGSVLKNPKGMQLAGRVAKGMIEGCIACHNSAPGNDKVFNHDRYK